MRVAKGVAGQHMSRVLSRWADWYTPFVTLCISINAHIHMYSLQSCNDVHSCYLYVKSRSFENWIVTLEIFNHCSRPWKSGLRIMYRSPYKWWTSTMFILQKHLPICIFISNYSHFQLMTHWIVRIIFKIM